MNSEFLLHARAARKMLQLLKFECHTLAGTSDIHAACSNSEATIPQVAGQNAYSVAKHECLHLESVPKYDHRESLAETSALGHL